MPDNKIPQRSGFGVGADKDFFAPTEGVAIPHKPSIPQKPPEEAPQKNTETAPKEPINPGVLSPSKSEPENIPKTFENTADGLTPLRTYRQDVAGVMRDKKTSLVRLVLEEQRERSKREQEISPTSRRNLPLIVLSILFFLSTIGVVYYIYFKLNPADHTLEDLHVTPLIFVEENKEILTGGKTPEKLTQETATALENKTLRVDAIEYFFFTEDIGVQTPDGMMPQKSLISSRRFFELLGIKIPPALLRSLRPEFMLGVHSFNKNQPFLILKTDYYDNAFVGMLEWEKTLPENILPLFDRTELVRELSLKKWDDTVIKNKDTRSLRNFDGSIALVYAFRDQRTLIITTSEDTLLEVSRRLDLVKEKRPE